MSNGGWNVWRGANKSAGRIVVCVLGTEEGEQAVGERDTFVIVDTGIRREDNQGMEPERTDL